ncbi:hypothetical protein G9A89_021604 [Geosiphon pyriformis]|nr:hypothetical protein G9A89_021604 [Geosiphon pyriformis]
MDKTTTESLFIIQKTQPKLSDNNTFRSSLSQIASEHQRTSTNNNYPKVAESEIIRTNHLGFTKSLFQ